MRSDLLLHIAALCVLLASVETLHGIARTVWLVPRVGKARALKLGIVSGTALAFAACYAMVPGMGLQGLVPHLAVGAVAAGFMAGFDLALGCGLLRKPLRRVLEDFDPRTGNYLLYGLAGLALAPAGVAWLLGRA